MKPFHAWVEEMANSIEDASTIVKDEHGNIVVPEKHTFAQKYEDRYGQLSHSELEEAWANRHEDYDDSYFD